MTIIGKPSITQVANALERVYEYGGGKWKVKVEVQGNDKGKEHKRYDNLA